MAHSELKLADCVVPDWPAPGSVRAFTTTRQGGVSEGVYASFNLGDHVQDDKNSVQQNRALLRQSFALPAEPLWLQQVHGSHVVQADSIATLAAPEADAAWTSKPGVVCAVMTADCLPVFFTSADGSRVAVAHGGWRGLLNGVLTATVAASGIEPQDCLAWLGPAIGSEAFEVGAEVRQAFIEKNGNNAVVFRQRDAERWLCDIYQLARIELEGLGCARIYGGGLCTFSDADRFYSYRRDGDTGRLASLIWLA